MTKPEMSFGVAITLVLMGVRSQAIEDLLSKWQGLLRGPGMYDRSRV